MQVLTKFDAEAVRAARDAGEFFWLDLVSPPDAELERAGDLLGLHPAAVEDSVEWDQIAKLDHYGDHLTLVFFSARLTPEGEQEAEAVEIHVHVASGWIVTVRRDGAGLEGLHEWLALDPPDCEDEILYHILDRLADGWDPVIEHLDARVDEIEREVLERTRQDQLRRIYRLKQTVSMLSHDSAPQGALVRATVDALHELPGLTRGSREWLRDVITHVDAVNGDLQRIAGDLRGLTDTFFNANANRLNRIATLLAVGGTFFLIWTLVTGFFGQNFEYLVGTIESRRDFLIYGVGSLVVPSLALAALLWWRRDDWWQ